METMPGTHGLRGRKGKIGAASGGINTGPREPYVH